jgi:4-amino-4-deoxy-L-arabinose transferase-like glycosyltransferase
MLAHHSHSARPARAAGIALFALLLGVYVLAMSGHTYASDEETMLAVGQSLLARGSFAIPPDEPFLMTTIGGVDGQRYSRYGPLQSVLAVPFIAAGNALALLTPGYNELVMRFVVLLLPALATAATAWLLVLWVAEMGFGARIGVLLGLLFGLTSLGWPHGRTFFAETLATLFLVLCGYGLRRESRLWWAIAGAAAVGALATKIQTGLALPVLALYTLAVCRRGSWPEFARALGGRLLFGLLGLALPLAALLGYNTLLFGAPTNSGYGSVGAQAVAQHGNWRTGLYGLTVSSGKGLLIYSPSILLGLIGLGARPRQQWRESLLAALMLVSHIAFYSNVGYWHGDGAWGPRYMVFVVPFAYLPAAGLLATLGERARGWRWAAGALAALSFFIQLLPLLVSFDTYIQYSEPKERYFRPAASPILAQPQIWLGRVREYWWRAAGGPPGTALLVKDFSYSEGDRSKGELFPRWSYADATWQLNPAGLGPLEGTLLVADHRPWPLPRANFELRLNGQPLADVERSNTDGDPIRWTLHFTLLPGQLARGMRLELVSDTWNPTRDTQDNPRNEDLGLLIERVSLEQDGKPLTFGEALPIPPPRMNRRALWLWTQDVPNHHLFDLWEWYAVASGMPATSVALLLAVFGLPALALIGFGGRGVWLALGGAPRSKRSNPTLAPQSP